MPATLVDIVGRKRERAPVHLLIKHCTYTYLMECQRHYVLRYGVFKTAVRFVFRSKWRAWGAVAKVHREQVNPAKLQSRIRCLGDRRR